MRDFIVNFIVNLFIIPKLFNIKAKRVRWHSELIQTRFRRRLEKHQIKTSIILLIFSYWSIINYFYSTCAATEDYCVNI